jgi:hypothetical protein
VPHHGPTRQGNVTNQHAQRWALGKCVSVARMREKVERLVHTVASDEVGGHKVRRSTHTKK